MIFDSRTTFKKVEDWLRKHGWWLFPAGIVFNLVALFLALGLGGAANPDALSVSLTILEVFIVVVALGGFWMMRGAAMNAAREAARNEIKRLAEEGYLVPPSKLNMVISNTGPAETPDLTNSVRETGDEGEE